ncbi:unnamed protein product, partial [marine sediment metagenome]
IIDGNNEITTGIVQVTVEDVNDQGDPPLHIIIGDGDAVVRTGAGNDTIVAGGAAGDNVIDGSTGSDHVIYASSTQDLTVDLRPMDRSTTMVSDGLTVGDLLINAGYEATLPVGLALGDDIGFDVLIDIENVTTGSGNDVITGGDGGHVIDAGEGQNLITTGSGDDVITAGDGGNVIDAGDGEDSIITGAGDDIIILSEGDHRDDPHRDNVDAGAGNNVIDAGGGVLREVSATTVDLRPLDRSETPVPSGGTVGDLLINAGYDPNTT